ncbi:MAG: hypothetical protein PHE67_00945 [Campylobacterales bacterium]|nr:hypothetical protein [Campylobacterales bacterium]
MDLNELNQILDRIKFQVAELKVASENVGEYQTCVVDISKAIREFEQNALKIVSTNNEILTANKILSKNMDARTSAQNEAIDALFDKLQKAISTSQNMLKDNAEKVQRQINGLSVKALSVVGFSCLVFGIALGVSGTLYFTNVKGVQAKLTTNQHPSLPENYYGQHKGKPILYFSLDDKTRMVGYFKEKNICYVGLEPNN